MDIEIPTVEVVDELLKENARLTYENIVLKLTLQKATSPGRPIPEVGYESGEPD